MSDSLLHSVVSKWSQCNINVGAFFYNLGPSHFPHYKDAICTLLKFVSVKMHFNTFSDVTSAHIALLLSLSL